MSPITTHVLNTATGEPARNLEISVSKNASKTEGIYEWMPVTSARTNNDGRVQDFLSGHTINAGDIFEFTFATQEYFDKKCFYPYVKVVFTIEDPTSHYHVPLLISPYGYSTYRGS